MIQDYMKLSKFAFPITFYNISQGMKELADKLGVPLACTGCGVCVPACPMNRMQYSSLIRFVSVPSIHILDADVVNAAFEYGAAGVLLIEGAKAEKRSRKSAKIDSESVNTIQQEQ